MTPTTTNASSIRVAACFLLAVVLALTACSGPSVGEDLSPAAPTTSTTKTATAEDGKTPMLVPSPSTQSVPTPEDENTATADPSTTEGPPPASTPVPPPTPGSINETIESRAAETKDPVNIEGIGTFEQEISAQITEIMEVEDPATGMPNEVAAPALIITVKLTNGTPKSLPLDSVVVELLDSADAPGGRMTGDPYDPLSGSLAAGAEASGTYVYTVAKDKRDPISVVMTLTADDPMVLFQGPVR